MPQWKVIGVDAETGMESSLVVEASTESVARIMAERRGIIVAEVLNRQSAPARVETARLPEPAMVSRVNPSTAELARKLNKPAGHIICPNPNCGYIGPPSRKARGSTLLLVLLLLLWILPGIIYLMLQSGYVYTCPRCGLGIRRDG